MKADIPDSYYIDRNIVHILRRMEMKGVKVNQDMLGEFYDQVKEEVSWYRSLITLKFGCDPGSNQQVGIILAKRGHRLPYTKGHKQFRVDEAILRDLDDPLAQTILLFREKSKLLSTYIEPLLGLERVHTKFNNTRVVTGRLSSSNPNMQNIPEYFRPCFEADDMWFDLDASQIELRVVAWLSQDRVLMEAFRNGEDIHRRTMLEMGLPPSPENRKLAKTINFAVLYGAEPFTVVETAKKEGIHLSLRDASGLIQQYFARMSGVKDWVDAMRSQVKTSGVVRTMYGRERYVSQEVLNDPGKLEKAMREMVNMPVQGTAAEIIKKCMARAGGYDLRLQVHDSLAYNGACPPPSKFENVAPFAIPMKLVVGKEWGMGDVIPYN
jgi:DNA polymerase-1